MITNKGKILELFIALRPFCKTLLDSVVDNYELIIFTAGKKYYADLIVSWLEEERKYFDHVLSSEHCVRFKNPSIMLKDLDILLEGRDLKDIVIVDNNILSYAYHLNNGIPIPDYNGCNDDVFLRKLITYFRTLEDEDDVRLKIAQDFLVNKMLGLVNY